MNVKGVREEEMLSKLSLVPKIHWFPDLVSLRSVYLLGLIWYWKSSLYNEYIKIMFS